MSKADRVEIERLIESLKKKGPPPPPALSPKPRPETDQDFSATETQFHAGMTQRLAAAELLANPFVIRQQILDKPFLVWQYPDPNLEGLVSSSLAPMNSLARVYYRANRGINTWITFHFPWANNNASSAVINIETRMLFTGSCFAQARGGAFSFNETLISLGVRLNMMRNSGWGSDPLTGNGTGVGSTQQSASTSVASVKAKGAPRIFFQGVSTASESFNFQPFDVSVHSFLVPAGASLIFMPTLYLYCSLEGDTLEDVVDVDFSTNGRAVRCPYVALTIQTPT